MRAATDPASLGANGQTTRAASAPVQPVATDGRENWNCIHCIKNWDRGNLYALRAGDVVTQGEKYCGVGVLLKECPKDPKRTRMAYIQFGSPAHFSGGLAVEDTILDIDGIPCVSLQQAAERIMGEAETLVRLRIRRYSDGGIQHVVLLRQVAFPSLLYKEKDIVGLGVVVASSKKDPHPRVVEIMPGSSAVLPGIEGLQLEDRVSFVNGKDVRKIEVARTARMIKGPRFSRVDMAIERDGAKHNVHLVRGELLSEEWTARAEAYHAQVAVLLEKEERRKKMREPTTNEVLAAIKDADSAPEVPATGTPSK